MYFHIVEFRNVYGIMVELPDELVNGIKSRLRLLPPHMEHWFQSVVRLFMCVGLPQDLVLIDYKV